MFAPLSCAPGPLSSSLLRPPAGSRLATAQLIFSKSAFSRGQGCPQRLEWSNEEPLPQGDGAPEPPPLRRVRPARDERVWALGSPSSRKTSLLSVWRTRPHGAREPESRVGEQVRVQVQGCVRGRSRSGGAAAATSRALSPPSTGPAPRELVSPRWTATAEALRIERRADPLPPQTDRRLSLIALRDRVRVLRRRLQDTRDEAVPGAGAVQAVGRVGRVLPPSRTPTRARFRRGEERHPRRRRLSTRLHRDGLSSRARVFVEDRHAPGVRPGLSRRNPTHARAAGHGGTQRLGVDFTPFTRASRRRRRLDLRDLVPLDPARCRRDERPAAELPPARGGAAGPTHLPTRLSPASTLREMIRLPPASRPAKTNAGVEASSERRVAIVPKARGEEEDGAEARGKRGEARGRDASRRGHGRNGSPRHSCAQNRAATGAPAAGVVVEPAEESPRREDFGGGARQRSAHAARIHRSPEYHAEAAPEGLRTNKHIFDRSGVFAPRTMDGLRLPS
ncbi:hypothetical protein Q5P01_000518 [Channa striata]|uniref:Uncharacterized protein n=1 Tax=Channa striata TaxID=64152 RepID=A0AA88LJ05_CHASR|nr:hypothetical protein Q5P01_000518 [Channa striata]